FACRPERDLRTFPSCAERTWSWADRRYEAKGGPQGCQDGEYGMSDMGLVVVGAAGRMGQVLVRAIHAAPGLRVAGAVERAASPQLGADVGELAGIGNLGVTISDD